MEKWSTPTADHMKKPCDGPLARTLCITERMSHRSEPTTCHLLLPPGPSSPRVEGHVRMAAVAALRRTGAPASVPELLTMVADPDDRLRSIAVGAVEALGGEIGPDALAVSAAQGGIDERWAAAGSVG